MNKFNLTTDVIYHSKANKEISIIHISDIHFNVNIKATFLTRLANYIAKQEPNYIMISGDLIDTPKITANNKIDELLDFLKDISKIAPVIISIGNHDVIVESDFEFFDKIDKLNNIHVLNNKLYIDDYIQVYGLTLPNNYYYNVYWEEPADILLLAISKNEEKWHKIDNNKPAILMVHSPIKLTDEEVLKKINIFDLVLSGHTHNGMVPKWLYFLFPKNSGIISPISGMFPKVAKGKIINNSNKKTTTIIINGAITKLSKLSGKILSNLNFLYNSSVNKIIITKKEGKNNE